MAGTKTEELVRYFQIYCYVKTGKLKSTKLYGFIKISNNVLENEKGNWLVDNRDKWTTSQNIDQMYNFVYEKMVNTGVATRFSLE